jgi:hypothetical protein
MLAIESPDGDAPPRPWLPAALLGDQLFLFDMGRGLPVPGPEGADIATLGQVIERPDLLQGLVESAGQAYPLSRRQLRSMVALIDATPAYLSQRMKLLEAVLLGEQKMVLTVSPSPLATALRQSKGINRVQLWTLPYEAFAGRAALTPSSPGVRELAREHSFFDRRTPLAQARLLHFRGRFEARDDRAGARSAYLECRTPDAQIRQLRQMSPDSTPSGLDQPTAERRAAYEAQLKELEVLMVRTKQHATFWLGLMAFDCGDYDVAEDYLRRRLLVPYPDSPWAAGARYNLGRSFEARGWQEQDGAWFQRAIQEYEAVGDSPVGLAARIRAHRLAEQSPIATSTETARP